MESFPTLPKIQARLARERRTIQLMSEIHCHKKHGSKIGCLCNECAELLSYALQRIEKCPFKDDKPTCRSCPVHCYKKDMRERVRRMMAYSGPWMLLYHPIL